MGQFSYDELRAGLTHRLLSTHLESDKLHLWDNCIQGHFLYLYSAQSNITHPVIILYVPFLDRAAHRKRELSSIGRRHMKQGQLFVDDNEVRSGHDPMQIEYIPEE